MKTIILKIFALSASEVIRPPLSEGITVSVRIRGKSPSIMEEANIVAAFRKAAEKVIGSLHN